MLGTTTQAKVLGCHLQTCVNGRIIMTDMTRQEAQAKISELVDQAYAALEQAATIADKFNLNVHFDLGYGSGTSYDTESKEWISSSSMC